jgi:hypothetical protein
MGTSMENSGERVPKQTSTPKPQGPIRAVRTQVIPSSKIVTVSHLWRSLEPAWSRGFMDEKQCGDSDGSGRYKLFNSTVSESRLYYKLSVRIPFIVDQNRGGE